MKTLNELTPSSAIHARDLFDRLGPSVGDGQVKGVVDRRFAGRFAVPGPQGVRQRVAALVQGEIDDRGRAAERRATVRWRSRRPSSSRRRACRGACADR